MSETKKRFTGGCHCGAVRYEVDLDLEAGTGRCNCTFCTKTSNWSAIVKPEAFRLLSGQESLSDYQHGAKLSHLYFCKHCGVRSFGQGDMPWLGGAFTSVNLNCLDDLDPSGILVRHFDGRHDAWQNPRVERLP